MCNMTIQFSNHVYAKLRFPNGTGNRISNICLRGQKAQNPNFVMLEKKMLWHLFLGMIVKYWGLKRRTRARLASQERPSKKQRKKIPQLLEFINNSKYIIFVLTSFTISWSPVIILTAGDIFFHHLQDLQKSWEVECGILTGQNLTSAEHNLGISCMEDLNIGFATQCEVPGDKGDVCVAFHSYTHDFFIVCMTRLVMCMLVLSSFINALIHGIWYPGFRLAVTNLRDR